MDVNTEKMGQLIAAVRKSRGMTQKALAESLNVTDKAVSKWERGLSCPDISLLPRLSELLDVTLEELLNGERAQSGDIAEPQHAQEWNVALSYANETVKSRMHTWRTVAAIVYSAGLLLGTVICILCDVAICGRFTWSLYPLVSTSFAWLIGFPLIKYRAKGAVRSLTALSVAILPFLYAIGLLAGRSRKIMEFSIPITLLVLAYLWGMYALSRRWKGKTLLIAAVAVAGCVPLALAVNVVVARLLPGIPVFDAWDWLATVCLAVLSGGLVLMHCRKRRQG